MLAVAVLLVGFALYQLFLKPDEPRTALQRVADPSGDAPSRDVARLLSNVRSISINESFFEDPVFRSLEDFSTPIAPQPQGRPNPFAPIGQDVEQGGQEDAEQATSTEQTEQ